MSRLSFALVVALGLAVWQAQARAQEGVAETFDHSRPDLGFGFLAGSFPVGSVVGTGIGLHLDAGWSTGPLFLYGEYDFLSIGQDPSSVDNPVRGQLHRVAAMARYSFERLRGDMAPIQGQFWLEGGVGRQIVVWNGGGRLHRNDAAVGLGAQFDLAIARDTPREQLFSIFYAFRMTIARAPDGKSTNPTCAGPCDQATPPSPWDLGLLFNAGLRWGH